MRIGLDFDGVVENCAKLKCAGAHELFGIDIPEEKMHEDIVLGEGLLTREQYRQMQHFVYESRPFGLAMEPVPGALEYVPRLCANYTVCIITSRSGVGLEIAEEWMGSQGLSVACTGVGHGASKADAAAGLDVYVDDDIKKLAQLVGVVRHRFLFSWPYNAHMETGAMARRVYSWATLYRAIRFLDHR